MADENTIQDAVDQVKAAASKAAPKRKPAVRRKPAAKRKPAARRKAASKRTARSDFSSRAQEASRNAFLASLGFYGKAYDQAQEQYHNLQDQLEARRKRADRFYQELVKRGKKVEKDAKSAVEDLDFPRIELDSLTDRKKLEEQLEKARTRLEELKEAVGLKAAA